MEYKDLILDMLNRIVKLEKEVELLKEERENKNDEESVNLGRPYSYVDKVHTIKHLEKEQASSIEAQRKLYEPDRFINDNYRPRDKTRYMFDGNVYLKNKLVFVVVKDYVSKHQAITCKELKTVFDKSLQGSIGVVEYEFIAKQRKDYKVRFFAEDDEILRLADGNMLVCSQWGVLNISNFIKRAEKMGYEIEQITRE